MRGAWLVVMTCGCGFSPHGASAVGDSRGSDAGSGSNTQHDARIDGDLALLDAPACTTTGLVCPGTSTVAKAVCNGGCWVTCTSNTILTEPAAAQACASWGGLLEPIRTIADQVCVATVLFPGQSSWIGFEQASTATTVGGGWSWNSDGITPAYTNWSAGQPNDQDLVENGADQCADMNGAGEWFDVDCTGTALYAFSCRRN